MVLFATDIKIIGNHFSGTVNGDRIIYLRQFDGVIISENTFLSDTTYSLVIFGCKHSLISNNSITGSVTYHIVLDLPQDNNYVIVYNILTNATTSAITGDTADMQIAHNITQ